MIIALMTGLGIGLAFWIVVIPTLILTIRKSSVTTETLNKRSLELLEERNQIDREVVGALFHIVNAIDNNTQRLSN